MKTLRSVLILALLALSARGDDWAHLGRDDGRTRLPTETIANPALLSSLASGSSAIASPVAVDGYIVLSGVDGIVRAYRESDQALLWSHATGSSVIGTPQVDLGRAYVPCLDGTLRVLRLADGVSLGSVAVGGSSHSSPLLSGGRIYVGTAFPNPALVAVDPATMSVAWSAPLDQVSHSSPTVGGGMVVMPSNNGTIAAFDAATGAPVWSTAVGGSPGGATPLILGGSVFIVIDGTLVRLDLGTGTPNALVSLTDPAPADTLSLEWACSPLSQSGGLLTGVARVDYALDHNHDGYVDAWTLRDFAFAVDPASMTLSWQTPLGSAADVGLNAIPPYRILPAPVSLGTTTAFASSVDAELRLLDAAGNPAGSFTLDAPSQASLLLANARFYALTTVGTLYALEDPAAPQPASVGGLSPSGAHLAAGPATLDWAAGPVGASYKVRLAQDDEILMDWDLEQVLGGTSIPCPVLVPEHRYTWAVRVRDASGAYAPWSTAQFAVGSAPLPASGLTAVPKHGRVLLSWQNSPSVNVTSYQVAYAVTGNALGAPADVGNVTTFAVEGLAIGTGYTFQVTAVNDLGFLSAPVSTTSTPISTVSIGGTSYGSISAALAAAHPGETVHLGADRYLIGAPLQIPPGVTLEGVNARDTTIVATSAITMIEAATGSRIEGLGLSGGSVGVSVTGQSVVITHCVIRGMSDAGVDVPGLATVVNNTIIDNTNVGARATGRADMRNNIVQGNGVGLSGIVVSKYNDVSDGYQGCTPGEGDRQSPVAFLSPSSGDYREQDGQPSLDAGAPGDSYANEPMYNGYRINMGAFGNTSLAATSPASAGGGSSSSCGLTGLEGVLLLLVLRALRRR